MSRPVRVTAQLLGLALIVLVLWLVGWRDQVTDDHGHVHRGHVIEQGDDFAVLRQGDRETRLPIKDATSVRGGLRRAFAPLLKNPLPALLGMGLHLAALLLTFWRWGVLLKGADLKTPAKDVLRLSWIGNFFAVAAPGGIASGDVVKSVYIARTHQGRKTRSVLTVWLDRVIALAVLCAIAGVAVLAAPDNSRFDDAKRVVLIAAVVAAVGLALLYSSRFAALLDKLPLGSVVKELRLALDVYRGRPGALGGAVGIALLSHTTFLAAFFFYGKALDIHLGWLAVAAAIPVAQIMAAIPGLPGGWGVGEFAMFFFLPAAGVPAASAVALSIMYRIAHTVLCLPGGLLIARGGSQLTTDS